MAKTLNLKRYLIHLISLKIILMNTNLHDDKPFSTICLEKKFCTSVWYLEKAICKHLVAACIKTIKNLRGLVFMPKKIVTRWLKRRVVYSSPVKVCNNLPNIEEINETHDTDQVQEVPPINVEPKKRGG